MNVPLSTAPTEMTPDQFADLWRQRQSDGLLPPFPVPPALPAGWWAAFRDALAAFGPILIRNP